MMSLSTGSHRVAVTGLGCITALGNDLPQTWSRLLEGQSGIQTIPHLDLSKLPVHIAGCVNDYEIAEELLHPREAPRFDLFARYALSSAHEALQNAQLLDTDAYQRERMGCILGVGIGGFPYIENQVENFLNRGARRTSPFFIPSVISNMAPGLVSIKLGLKGLNYTISSACASGSHALAVAAREIQLGLLDVVVTGGSESVLCNQTMAGFAAMKALSKRNDEPQLASRPFDKDRDGFVVGEGAGILVLENLERAQARGAHIYAEIVGTGANSDAFHITAPLEDGSGASACMQMALKDANLEAKQIDYVNAHGTSTPLGDIAETRAIKETFGKHDQNLLISSTKSMIGHLLGAAGGVESVFCVKALAEGIVPPTINLEHPDPECDLNYCPHKSVKKSIEYALNNSFGFGGTNSSTIFKRYDGH